MSVSVNALVSLAELQTYPGIPAALTAAQTSMFEALIDGTTAAIENFCHNGFVKRNYTEDYQWEEISKNWIGSNRQARIRLLHYPIVSVASITDPAGNTVASTDYWIDKPHGYLMTMARWDIPQDSNGFTTYWTIVYNAGRYAATANVDADLKLACKMQVAAAQARPDRSVKSKRVDSLSLDWTTSSESEVGNLLPAVKELLAPYVSRTI